MTNLKGLTDQEAVKLRESGDGNDVELSTSRTYGQILRKNFLNPINLLLFILAGVMLAMGRPSDAISTGGLILLNALIGTFQEIRAKRKLDKIALLTRPKVFIVRDGNEKEVDPAEIVRGDVIVADTGDQIVVDGDVLSGLIEVDESQLTGESDLVKKNEGDEVLSSSFVVTGKAYYEAVKVGAESFANKLTSEARKYVVFRTPLQKEVELILRVMMGVAAFLGFLIFVISFIYDLPALRGVQLTAIVIGLIPVGLIFMTIVAYSLGAMRLIGEGALIQETNAVESLSNVDILCTDKTGTLTANKLLFNEIFSQNEELMKKMLGKFAASGVSGNKTSEAIAKGLGGQESDVIDEVPFSSARKWSGLVFEEGAFVLGAPEMIKPYLKDNPKWEDKIEEWSNLGLRVLGFAYNPNLKTMHKGEEVSVNDLEPLGLVSLKDELRPNVEETIKGFQEAGVELKVISGDNPETVAALAKQAGLAGDFKVISGLELAKMDNIQFAKTAEITTVFGRITPEQKENIVSSLQQNGHYVAMTGDGVNDVLSLKKANLGIAMESGSAATRGVADILLLNDSFGALVPAFKEGQKILSGMTHIISLFMARTWTIALLIITTAFIRTGAPFLPNNNMLYAGLTVGIPTFFLAVWAESEKKHKNRLVHVMNFSAPIAILNMIFGTIIFATVFILLKDSLDGYVITVDQLSNLESVAGFQITSDDVAKMVATGYVARSALTVFLVLTGTVAIIFVRPYFKFLAVINKKTNDIKPTLLAFGMVILLIASLLIEPVRNFFELILLKPQDYLIITVLALIWSVMLWGVYKSNLLKKFFTIT